MSWELVQHDSAQGFLDVARTYLEEAESENSLPLGLALRSATGEHSDDEGTSFFSVQNDGEVRGVVLQSPSRACVFTAMEPHAAEFAARELPGRISELRGCNGPVDVVDAVANIWSRMGLGELEVHLSLRLFELTELQPARPTPGRLRLAEQGDLELCRLWAQRFLIDCNLPEGDPDRLPERVPALDQERLYLWDVDGVPVSSATWARPVASGVTIGFVYTPNELRGKGYASNVVSALTRGLLDGTLFQPARKRVTLYTDLANPTSNAIYAELGYRPIGDHRLHLFKKAQPPTG